MDYAPDNQVFRKLKDSDFFLNPDIARLKG